MNGSWHNYLASPTNIAGADDSITNLAKEREPGIEIIECTPCLENRRDFFAFFREAEASASHAQREGHEKNNACPHTIVHAFLVFIYECGYPPVSILN